MGVGERGEYWVQEDEGGVRAQGCLLESALVVCAGPTFELTRRRSQQLYHATQEIPNYPFEQREA